MRNTLALIVVAAVLTLPSLTYAQSGDGIVPCDGVECNACHFVELGNNIVEFLILISAAIGALAFIWAGFLLVTAGGSQSKLEQGKQIFTNVVIGFIILLAAWLIVDTVMKLLLPGNEGQIPDPQFGPWNEIECVTQETAMDETTPPAQQQDVIVAEGEELTHDEAVAKLNAAGIQVKDNASLEGVQPHVIDEAIALNQSCGCDVLVTEGTGGFHASGDLSHENGYKLDLRTRDNPDLVSHVESLPSAGQWRDGTQLYQDPNNCATYAVEGDHIDVVYPGGCAS